MEEETGQHVALVDHGVERPVNEGDDTPAVLEVPEVQNDAVR